MIQNISHSLQFGRKIHCYVIERFNLQRYEKNANRSNLDAKVKSKQ